MSKKHRRQTKMDKLRKKDDEVATRKENEQYFPPTKKTKTIEVKKATERRLKSGEVRVSIYETFMHHAIKKG